MLEFAQKLIDDQAVEIEHLRKQLFGRRSEKVLREQLSLFAQVVGAMAEQQPEAPQDEAGTSDDDSPDSDEEGDKKEKRKKTGGKRRSLQPTRTQEIRVPDADRPCPVCGEPRCTVGHVRSIVIEYTPAKIDVIEIIREKVACRPCDGEIVVAPPPRERVIERALPGPQMLSALVVNKTVDGLPLQRSRKIFKRAGLDIPIGTLSRWEGFAHRLLTPLVARLRTLVLEADTINLDDTGLRVRDQSAPGGTLSGHIWVFIGRKYDPGGDLLRTREFVFYLYAPTWEAEHPEKFLTGCSAALQGDAYRGYERIADENRGDRIGKLLAGCCMHARRPFVQALDIKDPAASFFVERFQTIYAVEERAKADKLTASARLELRRHESLPIMEQIRERAQMLSILPLTKPMKTGVTYFVNQWDKLIVPFTKDGRLDIDNGSAERRLRRVAAGRKSWLFAGSENGANRFADVLSLVSTADAAGVDAGAYFPSILPLIDSWPNKHIDDLLPYAWRDSREAALRDQLPK